MTYCSFILFNALRKYRGTADSLCRAHWLTEPKWSAVDWETEMHRSNSARTIHEEHPRVGYRVSLTTDPSRHVKLSLWHYSQRQRRNRIFDPEGFSRGGRGGSFICNPLYLCFSYMWMCTAVQKAQADGARLKKLFHLLSSVTASEVVMAFNFLSPCFSFSETCSLLRYMFCSVIRADFLTHTLVLWVSGSGCRWIFPPCEGLTCWSNCPECSCPQ